MVMKVLIIGGVAGGATAAARLRRLDESAEIVILERSGYVSYANCGLPYYIGGVIEKKQALTLQTKESFWNRFHIDVRLNSEALSIDRERNTVRVRHLLDGSEYEEAYDKLILSPGAKALRPPLPGIDSPRIFTLRTVEDTFAIREQIEKTRPGNAVVIGGGFIGLEMAENLIHAGIKTTLLQRGDQVMAPLDYDMACQIHSYLRGRGVDLRLNQTVTGFYEEDGRLYTQLEGREAVGADLAILAIGVAPETHLAREAGLSLGIRESILVNERMETSAEGIYAAGDCCAGTNIQSGERQIIGLWANANHQGTAAGINMAGGNARFEGNILHNITHFMDMDFIGFGDNRIQGETLVFGSLKQGLYLKAVCRDGRIAGVNILDSYPVSGMIKNYMLRLFQEPESRLPPFQIGMLVKAGLTEEFIERLEAAVHGDQGRAAESENSMPGNGN